MAFNLYRLYRWLPRPRGLHLLLAFTGTLILAAASPGPALADGGWLDRPVPQWNGPNQGIPRPPVQTNPRTGQPLDIAASVPAACFRQERGPLTEEEKQVAAAGWRLQAYWPPVQRDDVTVVTALSWYDGMCRPRAFQAFAFVGGRFAGTLSPGVMDARVDGVLRGAPSVLPGGVIEAAFTRYARTDPLCCPSLPPARVRYELVAVEGGRVFAPTAVSEEPRPGAEAPSRLPATGEATEALAARLVALGTALLVAGYLWRRERRSILLRGSQR